MARKPPNWRQLSLFPPRPPTGEGRGLADENRPHGNATTQTNGEDHAVQDDRSRTPATTNGDARPAAQGAEAPAGDGAVRPRAEDEPPGLEGTALGAEDGK